MLRIVKVFWNLDSTLAYARHFPAINWLTSYSLYIDRLMPWYAEHVDKDFPELYQKTMIMLQEEAELQEIVQLVGQDALSFADRLKLEACKSIREDYLHQNAFHEVDTYASLKKQFEMLKTILVFYHEAEKVMEAGASFKDVETHPVRERISRMKYYKEDELDRIEAVKEEVKKELEALVSEEGGGLSA